MTIIEKAGITIEMKMEKPIYTVGQMSRLTGVPKDTLLYYDRIDLLKPTYRVEDSRYRYYTHDQFWTLDIIHCCRTIGLPVDSIREILACNDPHRIAEIMKEYQTEVKRLRSFYDRVDAEIDWYLGEYNTAQTIETPSPVTVRHMAERKVVYGEDLEHHWDYHSKFMLASQNALSDHRAFQRLTGFVMDPAGLELNNFMKRGEYAEFSEDVMAEFDPSELMTIPEGDYACFAVKVIHRDVDFSPMTAWLREHNAAPELVLVEEAAFQLFWYFAEGYPCNVFVKLAR